MISSKVIVLFVIGIASGIAVAGGIFAFITSIGVINRLATRTHTAKRIVFYENCVILGGILGNFLCIFQMPCLLGNIGLGVFGIFSGVFTGCLAMALAEVLDVIPIFFQRVHLKHGFPYIITAMALGKGLGAFYQLYLCR